MEEIKEKRKQTDRDIDFYIEQYKIKFFSVCSFHLMENSMFVKHVS